MNFQSLWTWFLKALGLSLCSCIHHEVMDASGHKHTPVTCENKVILGQKHYQVAWGKLIGDQN
jgi:hypothetical protein